MAPGRHVYVPRKLRRGGSSSSSRHHQRFHGAFTGGFSAGYYNTAGSAEGWKPAESSASSEVAAGHADPLGDNNNNNNNNVNDNENNNANETDSAATAGQKQQRVEDFMDEHDFEEWGGPTAVRKEYNDESGSKNKGKDSSAASRRRRDDNLQQQQHQTAEVEERHLLLWNVDEPPANVGRRLLRILGWRGGENAYVQQQQQQQQDQQQQQQQNLGIKENNVTNDDDNDGDDDEVGGEQSQLRLLSRRRLRKIRVQQRRIVIPAAKTDRTGLGFEPYKDAPEFREHKERRKRAARARARQAAAAGSDRRSRGTVYRLDDVLEGGGGDDDDDDDDDAGDTARMASQQSRNGRHHDHQQEVEDHYAAEDTLEDFIGTKSSSGFALREDQDDAYDDEQGLTQVSGKVRLDEDAFGTVAYEHSESDEEERSATTTQQSAIDASIGGVLSSWASANSSTQLGSNNGDGATCARGVTADGRPPLKGFVLGGSGGGVGGQSALLNQRHRGPDVPYSYKLKPHVFGPDEHRMVVQAFSRAIKLQADDQRKRATIQKALDSNAAAVKARIVQNKTEPLALNAAVFDLKASMKSRFTAAKTEENTTKQTGMQPNRAPGLSLPVPPVPSTSLSLSKPGDFPDSEEVKITRSVLSFAPSSLLCKRFHVRMPENTIRALSGQINEVAEKGGENAYFGGILKKAKAAGGAGKCDANSADKVAGIPKKNALSLEETAEMEKKEEQRPAISIYKSIYEPGSAEASADDSDKGPEEGSIDGKTSAVDHSSNDESLTTSNLETHAGSQAHETNVSAKDQQTQVEQQSKQVIPYEGYRETAKKRHSRKRSHSSDSSDLDEYCSDDVKKRHRSRRRRHKSKHRRRKESRRRDDSKKSKKKKKKRSRREDD